MELAELKQQWNFLYQKLNEQQIVNERLMKQVVSSKRKLVSTNNDMFNITLSK